MTTTYTGARDEMFALLKSVVDAGAAAIVGYNPYVEYQGVDNAVKSPTDKFWSRVSTQTVISQQTTLSTCEGEIGKKRYTESGLLFVQLFAPKAADNVQKKLGLLAELNRKAFRGTTTPGHVWFRNARINELAQEALFLRINVVTEFEYDEIF
jgi:hypothetical protein